MEDREVDFDRLPEYEPMEHVEHPLPGRGAEHVLGHPSFQDDDVPEYEEEADPDQRYTVHGQGISADNRVVVGPELAAAPSVTAAHVAIRQLRADDPLVGKLGIRDTERQRWVFYPWR